MRRNTVRALLGKWLVEHKMVKYVHVDKVLRYDDIDAVATAFVTTNDGDTKHWIVKCYFEEDIEMKLQIAQLDVLREDECDGHAAH